MGKYGRFSSLAGLCGLALVLLSIPLFGLADEPVQQTAVEGSDADADLVSVLSRTTILVKDVDVSKRFYTYALGYEVLMDRDISRPIIRTQMGLGPEQNVRFAILKSSHIIEGKKRGGAGIGLIQVSNPAPPVMTRPEGADLASGEIMFAIRTTDIDTVYKRLLELNARILLHPMKVHGGTETELVVHDPDGVRIHVVERPDGKFD